MSTTSSKTQVDLAALQEVTSSVEDLIKYSSTLESRVATLTKEVEDLRKKAKDANDREKILLEKVASSATVADFVKKAVNKLHDDKLIGTKVHEKLAAAAAKQPVEVFNSMLDTISDTIRSVPVTGSLFEKSAAPARGVRPADPHGDFDFLNKKL